MNPEDDDFEESDSEADETIDTTEDIEASASEPEDIPEIKPSPLLLEYAEVDIDALRAKIEKTQEMAPGKDAPELFGITEADYKKFKGILKSIYAELTDDPRKRLRAVNTAPFGGAILDERGNILNIKKYLEIACQQSIDKLTSLGVNIDKLKGECSELLTKNASLLEYLLYQELMTSQLTTEAIPSPEEYDATRWSAPGMVWERLKKRLGVYSSDPRKRREGGDAYARHILNLNLDLMSPLKVKHKATHCSSESINFYELVSNPKYKNVEIPVGLLQMIVHKYEPQEMEARKKVQEVLTEILKRGKAAIRPSMGVVSTRPISRWEPTYPITELERRLYEKGKQTLIEPEGEAYAPHYMRRVLEHPSAVVAMTDVEGKPLEDFATLVKLVPELSKENLRLTRCMRERTNPPYWYVDYAVFLATESQIASGGKPLLNAMDADAINKARVNKLRRRSKMERDRYLEWQKKARAAITSFSNEKLDEAMKKTAENVAQTNVMPLSEATKFLDEYIHHKIKTPQNPTEERVAEAFWKLFDEIYNKDTIRRALIESDVIPQREVKALVSTKLDERKTLMCEDKWINSINSLNEPSYPTDMAKLVVHHLCRGTSEIPKATASKMGIDQSKSTRAYELLREANVLQFVPDRKVDEVKQAIEVAEIQKPGGGWELVPVFKPRTLWGQPEKVTDEFVQWMPQGRIDPVTGLHEDKIEVIEQQDPSFPNDPKKTIKVQYKIYDVLWQPHKPSQTKEEGKQWMPSGEKQTITGRTHVETRSVLVMPRESKLLPGYGATRGGISSLARIAQRMPQSRMQWNGTMWVAVGTPIYVPGNILSGTQVEHVPTPKTLEAACGIPSVDPLNPYGSLEQCREKSIQMPEEALAPMVQRLRTLVQGVRDKLRAEEEARQAKKGRIPGIIIVPPRRSWKREVLATTDIERLRKRREEEKK